MQCARCGHAQDDAAIYCSSCGMFLGKGSAITPVIRTEHGRTTTAYAGFWKRAAAWVIDAILVGIVNLIITGIIFGFDRSTSSSGSEFQFEFTAGMGAESLLSLAVGMPEISARANFLALFVVLPPSALLIYYFGLTGAGFSWVVYNLFAFWYTVPRICRHCLDVPVAPWYGYFARVLGLALGTYGLAGLSLVLLGANSLAALTLGYLLGTVLFALPALSSIDPGLRDSLSQFLRVSVGRAQTGDDT